MAAKEYFHYFVEGADEEKIVNVLKSDLRLIRSGKVHKLNVTQERLSSMRLRTLKAGTTVVLVFDTDAGNARILKENLQLLGKTRLIKRVVCIPQVRNLEDELIRSCNVKQVKELTGSVSNKNFKHDLIVDNVFHQKLLKHGFDIEKFWNMSADGVYEGLRNEANLIKFGK